MSFSDWLAEQGIEPGMDILFVSRSQLYRRGAQTGAQSRMTWSELADWLARPSIGDAKDLNGGWSPARYRDGHRSKADLLAIGALVVDIDGNGDVDRIADEVAAYEAIVHETFSSTNDDPRSRLVLRLVEAVDAATYEVAHAVVRTTLRRELDAQTDEGAKDASRLSYAPVRRPGEGYRFRRTSGRALDAKRVAAAQPARPVRARPVVSPNHADAYLRGALRRAVEAISAAADGARHETLNREAYALARLELSTDQIVDALLPAAVAAMGERRRREAERTIADAIRARKGAA